MIRNAVEGIKQAGNVAVGLLRAPAVAGVTVYLVKPVGRSILDADIGFGHAASGLVACDYVRRCQRVIRCFGCGIGVGQLSF